MSTFYRDQKLLANQFCEGENFLVWLSEKMRSYDNAGDWATYLEENLDIYKAEGYWLDLIGRIVGQDRVVPEAILVEFFGFDDTPAALGFGEARFWDGKEPLAGSSVLSDPEYRTVILARIAFNFADVSLPGITESLTVIFDTTNVDVMNVGTAAIRIYIGKELTNTEKQLVNALGLLPRAAGVRIDFKSTGVPEETFGFADTPFNYAGFGVGKFAEGF